MHGLRTNAAGGHGAFREAAPPARRGAAAGTRAAVVASLLLAAVAPPAGAAGTADRPAGAPAAGPAPSRSAAPPAAAADRAGYDPFARWRIRGSVSGRLETYGNEGDPDLGLYFSEGGQSFYEYDVDAERHLSPYERVTLDVFGVVNRSDYRSAERGLLLEQGQLTWEKGDAAVPFRAELGDHFGYFTFRTLQRSLKGVQVELQPAAGAGGRRNSLVLLAGSPADSYRELDTGDDLFGGLSWFSGDARGRAWSLNLVSNRRDAAAGAGGSRRQDVLSAAILQPLAAWGQRLELEGEVAHLRGDGDSASGAFTDRDDNGVFAQVTGRSAAVPLRYSARFERYGEHFSPRGGLVEPGTRNVETRVGWDFRGGPQLTLRAQSFRSGLQSANPLDTDTLGVTMTGPVDVEFLRRLSVDGDAFVQRARDRVRAVDQLTRSARLNLSTRFPDPAWTGRLSLFGRAVEDRRGGRRSETVTREAKLQVQRDVQVFGDWGYVGPEMLVRRTSGGGEDSTDLGPGLVFGLSGTRYTLDAWWFRLMQDRDAPGALDFDTDSIGFLFAWWKGDHYVELDANYDILDPRPGEATKSYRVGLQYTLSFDKAPQARPRRVSAAPAQAMPSVGDADLLALPPGADLGEAVNRIAAWNVQPGIEHDGYTVYDTRAFVPRIDQRQRLVLAHAGGALDGVALVIDLDDTGRPETLAELYERVRNMLIQRHGRPSAVVERGDFTPNLAEDLNTGRFARASDWRTPQGVLRFGIPRRRDREVRLEIRLARSLPAARGGYWSFEQVR